jgi:hypothetical protein
VSPSSPAGPAAPTPSARRASRLGTLALAAAIAATFLAIGALVVAGVAVAQARQAQRKADVVAAAASGTPVSQPDNTVPGQPNPQPPAATPNAGPGTAPTSDTINPTAQFVPVYQQQELQLQPAGCNPVYVDLDEPRVGARDHYELTLTSCSNRAYFDLVANVVGSSVGNANVTPKDCAEKIRTAPLADNAQIAPQAGVVLCIATSLQDATQQGISQKLVVVQVRAIGTDGTVNTLVSAWSIPR